jgi:hypothetical protein
MSLAVLADHMASKGRGPDSMLIHMSPREVQGLQALAEHHGGTLTINPETGLPEAGFLDKLLPTILGAGLTFMGVPPNVSAMIVGGIQTVRTGDLGKGISAGLGAYGGANLTSGLMEAGTSTIGAAEAAKGLTMTPDLAAELQIAGEGAKDTLLQQQVTDRMAAATPYEKLSSGFDSFKNNPMGMTKSLAMPAAMAFGPAILAEANVKNNMPQTVTKPGMIAPYASFGGQFVAGNPFQATPTKAAGGGLMGMDDGGYGPGQLDFTQRSEPVVRMADGGVPGYAGASDSLIFDYFKGLDQAKLGSGALDAQIAADMQKYKVSAADIARATGTQAQQGALEQRFVQAINPATMNAPEFLTATQNVGLQNQGLANALQGSGMSTGAQYAATHRLDDAAGIASAPQAAQDFYNSYGYKAGDAPGDQGGLKGLYSNINYAATKLQDQINAGKLSVQQAQDLSLNELNRLGLSVNDVKSATGKTFGSLFTPKTVVTKDTVTGAIGNDVITKSGFHIEDGVLVPNISSTQNTSTDVTTPTGINVADASALPVGVSGAGITTINPNGTITTRPDLSLEMQDVRDDYVRGGGSLGVNKALFAPTTTKEIEDRYKLTGGSKQAMDYLTGKTKYTPIPYTEDGQISKSYAESVMKIPVASSSKMYIFKNGKYEVNPDYAIPTYDKDGKKSLNLTNADVKTFMNTKPSTDVFYTWATTNNLSPEQIALASDRPINEISKLFTGAKDLVGDDGKVDQTKVDAKEEENIKTNWDEAAYLAAHKDVADELKTGKSVSGQPVQFTSGYEHWLRYGKDTGVKPTVKKAAGGGLMNMARNGMSQQFDLGGYSDGGRLLRGPGDGVSDSIPATIGNKRPARLADGEFVVPARIVSELGNGSTEAGARKLYAMMDRVQSARRGTVGKGRVAKNSRSDKYLPA